MHFEVTEYFVNIFYLNFRPSRKVERKALKYFGQTSFNQTLIDSNAASVLYIKDFQACKILFGPPDLKGKGNQGYCLDSINTREGSELRAS